MTQDVQKTIKKSGGFLFTWMIIYSVCNAQQPISQIRLLPTGSVVTTTGTISSGAEFGTIRYMQDAGAGIAIYDEDLSNTQPGDSLLVTGVLSFYRGELQLSPVISFEVIQPVKMTEPLVIENFQEVSTGEFESRKIVIPCAGIHSCESELDAGWYEMFDQFGNIARLWIAEDHLVKGFPVLDRPVSIEGIWTKFEDQYQLKCQGIADASEGSCHYISPPQLYFSEDHPVIYWAHIPYAETSAIIRGGAIDLIYDFGLWGLYAEVRPENLEEGKIYTAQLVQQDSHGVFFYSIPLHFSAPSAEKSIEVLFNRSIDHTFSDGSAPLAIGSSAIETDLIERIDNVTSTLDIAMYNTGRSSIVQAITRAVQRGVSVRYIADDETSNTALEGPLSFPVLYRSGEGIMHNKFVIADSDFGSRAWLWTGSTNLTTNQLAVDPNHAYIIHDQALARNYQREFDEMWGEGSGFNRFGDFKTNNTAHLFQVGDALIESWFSPSDETNCHLIDALRSTDHQVLIGLLLLTMEDVVDEVIALHQQGKEVRVIIEDEESSSEALLKLTQAGVDIAIHDPSSIFHHKYAIIDEGYPDSDPQVITGSHNWTWSADNINDENTLILHDQSMTNIFRQEFEARWKELNPSSTQEISINTIEAYPNPATDAIHIHNPTTQTCNVVFYDVHGQWLFSQIVQASQSSVVQLDKSISPGIYMLRFAWPDHKFTTQAIFVQ